MLHVVERERRIINESVGELCGKEVTRRVGMSQRSWSRIRGCAAARVGWEVIVDVTVHDKRSNLRQKGASGVQLRQELRARFGTIYRQEGINDSEVEGMVEYTFKQYYKIPWASLEATLGCLIFEPV